MDPQKSREPETHGGDRAGAGRPKNGEARREQNQADNLKCKDDYGNRSAYRIGKLRRFG
jgi:hypothetical protein